MRRWRIWQEVIKGLTKIYKEMTKRGILTNGDYNKNGKLGNNSIKVWQNPNEMTNVRSFVSIIVSFTKMKKLARIYKRFCKN